jgi:hypothetical protein
MAAKERSLDIFDLLKTLDQKNLHIWENLSEDQQKEFSPLVTLKWLRGTSNLEQLTYLNELVNPIVFHLGSEKEFILKMMAVCTSGGTKRYSWQPAKTASSKKKDELKIKVITNSTGHSRKKIRDIESIFSDDQVIEMAENLGWQKEELAQLKKELKANSKTQ